MTAYAPGKFPLVERWRPFVRRHLPGVPEDFVLAWIHHESGGRMGVRTSLDERGILQIHPGEAEGMGLSDVEWAQLLKDGDADEHMRISAKLVRHKEAVTRRLMASLGIRFTGRDFWTLVKLSHGLPAIISQGGKAFVGAHGRPPRSFGEFAAWLRRTRWSYKGWGPDRIDTILKNAENAGRWVKEGVGILGIALTGFGIWWFFLRDRRLRRTS